MTDEMRAAIEELNKKPCECVFCDVCRGTGRYTAWDITAYQDVGECPECDGIEILEMCERCRKMGELWEQELEAEERQ